MSQPVALEIGQETLADGRILGRTVPDAQCVFSTRVIDAQCQHDAVFADVDAVDQQSHQIERVERGRSPGLELCGGLRDEPATHRALARAAGADLGAPAASSVHHNERVVRDQPAAHPDFRREEICSNHGVPVGPKKGLPEDRPFTSRRNALLLQDSRTGRPCHTVAEILQGPLDSGIAPAFAPGPGGSRK